MNGLFVPGWGATAGLYVAGLPEGWEALELPAFRTTRGELLAYRRWLGAEITRQERQSRLPAIRWRWLALLAAVDQPEMVEKLILLSPAGLPLNKPLWASTTTFVGQVARGCYPAGELCRALAGTATAPRAALRVARTVHDLDVTPELSGSARIAFPAPSSDARATS